MKRAILFLLKVSVAVGLVVVLIDRVDWEKVLNQLRNASPWLVFSYVVFQLIGNVISAKKWQVIARYKELTITLKEAFYTYLTGAFINNFLPSTLGGDAYRAFWLAKRSGAKAAAASTVLFDRFIGLWSAAVLALLAGISLMPYFGKSLPLVITYGAVVSFLIMDLLITWLYTCGWFRTRIEQLSFQKLRRILQEVMFYTRRDIWTMTSLYSVLFAVVGIALSNYMLFLALGSPIEFFQFMSVIFLVTIVSSVPVSINNIGIKEWAYVSFFGLLGVSLETAVTVALLSRFLQMLIPFIALPRYISERGKEAIAAEV